MARTDQAAAAAARARAEAQRRRAEEAKRRADEARQKAAQAAQQKALQAERAGARAVAKTERLGISASAKGKGFKTSDELSTGRGAALRDSVLRTTGGTSTAERVSSSAPRFSITQLRAAQKSGTLPTPESLRALQTTDVAPATPSVAAAGQTGAIDARVRAAVDGALSTRATDTQRQQAYEAVKASVEKLGGLGDAGITAEALPAHAREVLRAQGLPTAASSEAVESAVDLVLGDDATPAQRRQALERVQAYVDEVGGVGDSGITAEALPERAAELLEAAGLPVVAQAEVRDVVDAQLSPDATPAQRREAWERAQTYLDEVGGFGDAGITREAFPGRVAELLREADLPSVASARADDVRRAAETGDTQAVIDALDAASEGLTPEQRTALLTELEPVLEDVAADLQARLTKPPAHSGEAHLANAAAREAADFTDALFRAADGATPAGTEAAARALAAGFPSGGHDALSDAIERNVAEGRAPALAGALGTTLTALGKTAAAESVGAASVKGLEGATETAKSAREALAEHEQMLASDLAALGPALTPEQRQAYTEAFWKDPDHKAVLDASNAAADALAETLEATDVERLAAQGGDAAKATFEAYEVLAQSTAHASEALEFVETLGRSPQLLEAMRAELGDDFDTRLQEGLVAPALQHAQSAALAEALESDDPGALDAALAGFQASIDRLGQVADTLNLPASVRELGAGVAALRAGDVDAASAAAERMTQSGDALTGPLKGMLVAVGLVQAGHGAISEPGLESFLRLADAGVGATSTALNVLADAGKVSTAAAEGFAKFAGRLAPGISLVLNGKQFVDEFAALQRDGNAGDVIKLFGTGINVIGDIAGLVPIAGTAVDVGLTVIGTFVHTVGDLIDTVITGNRERDALEAERRELLTAAGVSSADVELLLESPGTPGALSASGLTPSQVKDVMRKLDADGMAGELAYIALDVGAAHGLTGQALLDLVDDLTDPAIAERLEREGVAFNYPLGIRDITEGGLEGESLSYAIEGARLGFMHILETVAPEVADAWRARLEGAGEFTFNSQWFTGVESQRGL
ncbi:MAG: hypothetical protein SFW67_35830 [Myxococcaceae bacterium]|nr:hypothetical protein [Myxococcaceae bacterium]